MLEIIVVGVVAFILLFTVFFLSLKRAGKITLEERLYHRRGAYQEEVNEKRLNPIEQLDLELRQSGVSISVTVYILIGVVGAATVYFLFQYLLEDLLGAVTAGLVIGFYLPKQLLGVLRQQKMQEFDLSFSKALKRMSASMRSGSTLLQSVQSVVETPTMPKAIREEMSLVLVDYDYGDSLDVAFRRMGDRTGVQDAKSIAISIEIGLNQGSKLFEVFDNYVNAIMDRKEAEAEARASLAMTRSSINMLVLIPFLFTAGMKAMSPGYFESVYSYSGGIGKYIFFAIYGFVLVGYVYLMRKCNVRI